MSRDFADTAADYLDRSGAVVTACPLTVACWIRCDDAASGDSLISLGIAGSTNNYFSLQTLSTSVLCARSRDTATTLTLACTVTYSTATWMHCLAGWDTTTSKLWFQDVAGTAQSRTTATPTSIPAGINYTIIGQHPDNASGLFDGRIAHVAIWNAVLTDDEAKALGAGRRSPLAVRPGSLKAYYPFLGRNSPEIDIISGNSLTVHGTTTGAEDPPVLWLPGRRKRFIPAVVGGSAPTFASGPVINSTTTGAYTIGYTPSASCTFYAVAVKVGDTVPSVAQVKAGQNAAGSAALAAVSEAVTGADTTVLGSALTRPIHDIHTVLNNANGDSAIASITASLLTAAGGRQYLVYNSSGATAESLCAGASPAIVTGDVIDFSTTLSPGGEAVSANAAGIPNYVPSAISSLVVTTSDTLPTGLSITASVLSGTPTASGVTAVQLVFTGNSGAISGISDFALSFTQNVAITPVDLRTYGPSSAYDTSRRSLTRRFWDISLDAYSDGSAVLYYINNQAPTGPDFTLTFDINVAISAVDLRTLGDDAEGDTLVVTAFTALPTGLSVTSSSLTGTPTVAGLSTTTFRFTDIVGEFTDVDCQFNILTPGGTTVMPTIIGLTQTAADTALVAAGLVSGLVTFQINAPLVGLVLSASQDPGDTLSLGSAVDYVVATAGDPPIFYWTPTVA